MLRLILLLMFTLAQSAAVGAADPGSKRASAKKPAPRLRSDMLLLRSESALVIDREGTVYFAHEANEPRPIASITKLMTGLVIAESLLPMSEEIRIGDADRDHLRHTRSRLRVGARLTRGDLLLLALMSSENRAAAALARTYPGGTKAFVEAMNAKAIELKMFNTYFSDATGLNGNNVSTSRDLAKLVWAARDNSLLAAFTTRRSTSVRPYIRRGSLRYANTNRLLRNKRWEIHLSKTGFINEAGRCLVMQANIAGQAVAIVLLNSYGKLTPFGDANRIRKWMVRNIRDYKVRKAIRNLKAAAATSISRQESPVEAGSARE